MRADEFQFQALADARSDGFRFLVWRDGAGIQPDQNPLMSGLNFGEVHLPANSMENGAARVTGGSEGNVGGARGMVDLAIGAADHDDVSGGLPAHLGLEVVLARGQNLAPNREGEGNLEGKLVTGADRDGHGRRRRGFWKDQNVFDCVFHRYLLRKARLFRLGAQSRQLRLHLTWCTLPEAGKTNNARRVKLR